MMMTTATTTATTTTTAINRSLLASSSSSSSSSSRWDTALDIWSLYLFPPVLLLVRIQLASRLPISDCDEVFNYWEPTHYVVSNKAAGQQTWEYANEYALRTYAYIGLMAWMIYPTIMMLSKYTFLLMTTLSSSSSFSAATTAAATATPGTPTTATATTAIIQWARWLSPYPVVTLRVAMFVCGRAGLAAITAACEIVWFYALHQQSIAEQEEFVFNMQRLRRQQQQLRRNRLLQQSSPLLRARASRLVDTISNSNLVQSLSALSLSSFAPAVSAAVVSVATSTQQQQPSSSSQVEHHIDDDEVVMEQDTNMMDDPNNNNKPSDDIHDIHDIDNADADDIDDNYDDVDNDNNDDDNDDDDDDDCSMISISFEPVLTRTVLAWTRVLHVSAVGMQQAAAAYVPSSTWMAIILLSMSSVLLLRKHETQKHHHHHQQQSDQQQTNNGGSINVDWMDAVFVILAVTATLATGWPFASLLCMPTGLYMMWQTTTVRGWRSLCALILWIIVVTVIVQVAVSAVDANYYGSWSIWPLYNIIQYNAAGNGDNLYGTEPPSYYVRNLLLQLPVAAPILAIAIGPVLWYSQRRVAHVPLLIHVFAPMYLWLTLMMSRPHKEERFLFPIYPALLLGGVLVWDAACNAAGRCVASLSRHKHLSTHARNLAHAAIWFPCAAVGVLRIQALMRYYAAPLAIYAVLAGQQPPTTTTTNNQATTTVCTCGEWYRFPSSFYLPENNNNNNTSSMSTASIAEIQFLPSSFRGQLPQAFTKAGSTAASRQLLSRPFNDQNQATHFLKEEGDVVDVGSMCNYLVVRLEKPYDSNYHYHPTRQQQQQDADDVCLQFVNNRPDQLLPLINVPFLNAAKTRIWHRVIYWPYWHEQALLPNADDNNNNNNKSNSVVYDDYILYQVLGTTVRA